MKTLLSSFALLTCGYTIAHPGHDHSHWLSEPIHLLSALAIVAVIGTAGYVLKNSRRLEKNKEK